MSVSVRQIAQGCHAKAVYLDEIVAKIEAAKVLRKHNYEVQTYRCPNCGFWHLTKRRKLA